MNKYIITNNEVLIEIKNNKIKNLRRANKSQNCTNRESANSNNTSGFRNVITRGKFWRVQLQIGGKNKLFPQKFKSPSIANVLAMELREKYYKKFKGK